MKLWAAAVAVLDLPVIMADLAAAVLRIIAILQFFRNLEVMPNSQGLFLVGMATMVV